MKRSMFVIIILLVVNTLVSIPVHAQDAFSLGIYPPVFEIRATPPTEFIQDLSIQNFTEEELPLRIQIQPFRPSDRKNGQVAYDTDRFGGPDVLIKQKIRVLDQDRDINTLTLGPLETKKLRLGIDLKEHDPAGDYYFSVIFLSDTQEGTQKGSTIPAGIGTNILLSVGPQGPTKGNIEIFSTERFFTHGPVPFELLVKNTSEHYIEPSGSVEIENMFGQKIGKVDILAQPVLANSERYLIDTKQINPDKQEELLAKVYSRSKGSSFADKIPVIIWQENFILGIYKANLKLSLSENGPLLTTQTWFVALPLPVLVGIVGILLIITGIYLRVKKKRRYMR